MAYSDFTLDSLRHKFGLIIEFTTGVFSGIAAHPLPPDVVASIQRNLPLAVGGSKEDLNTGVAQCLAAMAAARLFNEHKKQPTPIIYGCVTSGTAWRFLRLEGTTATVDLDEVYIADADKIFGVLLWMARGDVNQ